MSSNLLLLLTTVPKEFDSQSLIKQLLQKKLCVCVQVIPTIKSFYNWDGNLVEDEEQQLQIKFISKNQTELEKEIINSHPYNVPEIIAITPNYVSKSYLDWANSDH